MAGTIEQKLAAQGVVLHEPTSPIANYVGFVRTGNLLIVSGQVCVDPQGKLIAKGKLGAGVTVEQGNAAARGCAINLLAQVKAALGDLDKVVRVVRLGGFVNSAPDFLDGPKVLNGASDLMVAASATRAVTPAPPSASPRFRRTRRSRSRESSRSRKDALWCARPIG